MEGDWSKRRAFRRITTQQFTHMSISKLFARKTICCFSKLHLVFILGLVYLPFFAYTVAVFLPSDPGWYDLVGCILVLLNTIYFVGLRDISKKLTDPYGDDLHDLSVLNYIQSTFIGCRRLMTAQIPKTTSQQEEEDMEQSRPPLGKGFSQAGKGRRRSVLRKQYSRMMNFGGKGSRVAKNKVISNDK